MPANYTGPTAGYAAGAQANDTLFSYAQEMNYGVAPAAIYTGIRTTGESFKKAKTRSRPDEINTLNEVSQAVTTQESVDGSINIALSYGTYDDLLAGALDADFATNLVTSTAAGGALPVTVQTPPSDQTLGTGVFWTVGSGAGWPTYGVLRVAGTTQTLIPLGLYLYSILNSAGLVLYPLNAAAQVLTAGALPAGVTLTNVSMRNGKTFKSYTLREKMNGAFMQRSGGYVSKASLSFQQGQFATGSFDFMFASQQKILTDVATSVTTAPAGPVMEMVKGFGGLFMDTLPVGAKLRGVTCTLSSDGAGQDFAMGSAAAVGQRPGSFLGAGQATLYFPDYKLYDRFEAETLGPITAVVRDATGAAYALHWLNATLQNPVINAGKKNDPIVATFDIEANPLPQGGTFQLDRL